MNRIEHLLVIASEECSEVSHRASKALRFGLDEVQYSQTKTNAERLVDEFLDLLTIFDMLDDAGAINLPVELEIPSNLTYTRRDKINSYLGFSKELGTLKEDSDT